MISLLETFEEVLSRLRELRAKGFAYEILKLGPIGPFARPVLILFKREVSCNILLPKSS